MSVELVATILGFVLSVLTVVLGFIISLRQLKDKVGAVAATVVDQVAAVATTVEAVRVDVNSNAEKLVTASLVEKTKLEAEIATVRAENKILMLAVVPPKVQP